MKEILDHFSDFRCGRCHSFCIFLLRADTLPPNRVSLWMFLRRGWDYYRCRNDAGGEQTAMQAPRTTQAQYTLESVALFRGLPLETLERIKRRCSCRRYGPRKSIIGHLDTSDDVCFLLSGNARVTIRSVDGKAVSFRELSAGTTFGEYAAIDGRPRSASVEARTSCLVASMASAAFREILLTEPKAAENLFKHFVMEIRELTPACTSSVRLPSDIAFRPRCCGLLICRRATVRLLTSLQRRRTLKMHSHKYAPRGRHARAQSPRQDRHSRAAKP